MTDLDTTPGSTAGAGSSEPDALRMEAAGLIDDVVALVRRWLAASSNQPVDSSATQLAGVLKDPNGLAFTVGFVDGVVRPEDLRVAARNLAELAPKVPAFLPWYLKGLVRLGGVMAPVLPGLVVPASRTVLRRMVGHLIIDATDQRLGTAIAKIRTDGVRLNMNLLGEAVLGEHEAERRLHGTHRLLARDDVDYVSIKVSSTVAPHSVWAFDEAVDHVVSSLTPLFERAASFEKPKFINLDMEEYKDLDLTIAVFTRILDLPHLKHLEAGIVLQAYLPDAVEAMVRLQEWAAARRADGGAAIKVRIVKGANLSMELVEASLHDWPLATWSTKQDSDTNYKRLVGYALHPDRIGNVRIGVAGHNLFDLAFAWLLAKKRGVESGIEFEMLLGMAQGQAEAVKKDVGGLLLYTPVVHPKEFDVAIAYLIRRLEEGASQENFMSAVFELTENEALFERERERFVDSLADLDESVPAPRRGQNRAAEASHHGAPAEALAPATADAPSIPPFVNTPDTDPALPANRVWGREILSRVEGSTLGAGGVARAELTSEAELDAVIQDARDSAAGWAALSGLERAVILNRAADRLAEHRGDLLEVMASETGKTLDQSDPEVSEAIDFARFYAGSALELDQIDGARFVSAAVTVVSPPWNFPVAIPAGSTLAALAAGSSVIMKPAPQAARCGAVLVEALWEAGVPRSVLKLVTLDEQRLGRQLVSDRRVDRVILTGAFETAELFRSFRTDLPLLAETSGKNAIIVTPSADFDLAVKDVVSSAFGHAGQKCSAASLVILVGSAATSARFNNQLVDAVRALKVGYPADPTTQMGPIIERATGKLLDALTTLKPGETWAVEPRQLDDSGRLWSAGLRTGVARGSEFHLTEYFGPVLGIMTAETLEEAIALQNEVDYGLTAGLHSLDPDELRLWLDTVQAGNLYVNRGTTGAIVRRQPFGGWKKSAVGAGTKAGGPNYLFGLGSWVPEEDAPADVFLARSKESDRAAWATEFGTAKDVSGLTAERNIFRYRPLPVTIRLSEGEPVELLVRVLSAAQTAGAPVEVSSAIAVPAAAAAGLPPIAQLTVETDAEWLRRASTLPLQRVRLIGGSRSALAEATGGRPDLAVYDNPVTSAGRLELLPFLHEQAISITRHRFGAPSTLSDGVV
ncbi:bifunctional proline dehydrogenase/L-glutamate gamma-semialdehyde dehydrogenase [Subtercola boreus]|uniref:L-glutamate gamma-semialdehyde dehydrogenase n=1 Tax=Subtercola boreus TaxID=120213 RepID=A0A3E0WA93_9MICO|nr:bifunctional proline dehydrogenase/L-glutamate gamma-semialdehyde dehydrogenase [Subtercola boreus]RFA19019.1 1-pyrroline-5-carboxylate dehydrogenase [Subtercola boreus]RFA19157.1 1-pyrroline-5-carboxylate dehydrogenase [Subtercola boreus]RFA25619.1 1-pyrroline-5-carboxylate dehydrogenase [Subtercola boreus]